MSEILEYSFQNITYDAALEFARIQGDAFRDDPLINSLIPSYGRYPTKDWPSVADSEKLAEMLARFQKDIKSAARFIHQDVASNPRHRIMMLQTDSRKVVAGTYWVLPKYLDLPKVSLFQRLKIYLRGLIYKAIDFFAYFKTGNPFGQGDFFAEIAWAEKETGAADSESRERELVDSNPKQLREITYPKNLTYYLFIMCVRTDEHGKGYGKQLLNSSLSRLAPYERPPHIYGPPKASLMSAPTARGFYLSCGWEVGAVAEHTLPNGYPALHSYYFKNLD